MNSVRTYTLLIAALAAGTGGRLVFHRMSEDAEARKISAQSSRAAGAGGSPVTTPSLPRGPRPEPNAVLSAAGASRLRLLMAWLPGAGDGELLHMAEDLMKSAEDDTLCIRLLMARWAEVNPPALLAWSHTQSGSMGYPNSFYMNNAIEAWARVDFDAAWAATGASPGLKKCRCSALIGLTAVDTEKCRLLLAADPSLMDLNGNPDAGKILLRIAVRNPQGAAALLEGAPVARQAHLAATVADAWAKADPAGAAAWLRTLPAEVRASSSMVGTASWIATHAPDQVPALLEGLPPGNLQSSVVAADLYRLATEDPVAARRRLEEMPPGPARQYGRALLMQGLFRAGDVAGATEMGRQIGWHVHDSWKPEDSSFEYVITRTAGGVGEAPMNAMKELVANIAASDPKAAAGILATKGCDMELAYAAAAANPAAVASAMAALPRDNTTVFVCAAVVGAWAASDPEAAAAWVGSSKSEYRLDYMNSLVMAWAQADPAAMLKWASQQEGGPAMAWFNIPPEYAMAHLDDLFAAGVPNCVGRLLGNLSPESADARKVMQQMPGDINVPLESVLNPWLKEDAQAASGWVAGLLPGAKREQAAEALGHWLFNEEHDYEAAYRWAVTLPAEKGASLAANAMNSLRQEDPAKAEAVLRTNPLPPAAAALERYMGPAPSPR